MRNGVINIYKERGFTSHDVVAKLRGILKQKKIGHTGTLDPEAEGVLPVCLGKGTKLCDMLTDHDKTYEAVMLLGQSTDTQDTTGRILEQAPVDVSDETVREAILGFVGKYEQVPPMYSALKVNGQKLCDLARAGKEVERKARTVEIYKIEILDLSLPRVRMSVSCSKGTYIRTLCHDIGERLGCHGCMEKLVRTKVGQFLLEDSLTLAQVEALRDEGRLEEVITAVDQMFRELPALTLKAESARLGYNGNPFRREDADISSGPGPAHSSGAGHMPGADRSPGAAPLSGAGHMPGADRSPGAAPLSGTGRVRVYDPAGQFIGIYERRPGQELYRPVKMFYEK